MPDEHVSILQSLGVAVLALAAVVSALGLIGLVRSARSGPGLWLTCRTLWFTGRTPLRAFPHQRHTPPHLESVELTPGERDAFAGLVRQLSGDR
ncbi:hypothetical protein GCM10022403_042910 [Streptomyces coacervatus]|uniref:Uncharacterized protein n=1 Tax=Streptomyces coacervatus TaxID=647381 RepID=A0ABP7HX18_9ACTN|nr:hypothetical protein [Streptomyces coacervatus]MDF2267130.1 hypothetical protein [Streptomyces coacervatus]